MSNREVNAGWSEKREVYFVDSREWESDDGDTWYRCDGSTVETEEFSRLTIRFIGGPRDGVVVC